MTDYPVLIPTAEGAIGGIVSEPERGISAALVLLAGYGRPARSGVNSVWTRLARRLADHGVIVLRVDYAGEGETQPVHGTWSDQDGKRALDLRLTRQVLLWFRPRIFGAPLFLAGLCSGARGAIELVANDPGPFAGAFLVAPHMTVPAGAQRQCPHDGVPLHRAADAEELGFVDPQLVDELRLLLSRTPAWLLIGENDTTADVARLREVLGSTDHQLEIEVVEGMAIHLVDQPHIQRQVESRLFSQVKGAVIAPSLA